MINRVMLLLALSLSTACLAAPRIHIDVNAGSYSISDPEGVVEAEMGVGVSGGTTFTLSRAHGIGLYSDFGYYYNSFISNTPLAVSAKMTSLYTNQVIQKQLMNVGGFNFIAGLGMGVAFNDYTNRLVLDGGGYIDRYLDDRSTVSFSAVGQFGFLAPRIPLNLGRYRLNIKPAVFIQSTWPLGDDLQTLEVKTAIIF